MGRKNKYYSINLKEQVRRNLASKQAFGESKYIAKKDGTATEKIYSASTYQTYKKHLFYFAKWISQTHPDATTLKSARQYANEWLQERADAGLSAWTIQIEAKALGKLYGITPADKEYFTPPERRREDIKRSRLIVKTDNHFSTSKNDMLIKFCRAVGARRGGLQKIRGQDLWTLEKIYTQKAELLAKKQKAELASDDNAMLNALSDVSIFDNRFEYFVFLKEKGGKIRFAPIVADRKDLTLVLDFFAKCLPEQQLWPKPHRHADIHGYRADYANRLYSVFARDPDTIPFNERYYCRGERKGLMLDKKAIIKVEKALGHNRIDTFVQNYWRG